MGLSDIVRGGVAIANSLTSSLQVQVNHYPWISDNAAGEPEFDTPIVRQGLHERKQKLIRTSSGTEIMSTSSITFVGPIASNGAVGRREPIDARDRLVFFDGESGKIVDVQGLDDPLTGRPYLYQVFLG